MKQWYYLFRKKIDYLDIVSQQFVYQSFYQLVYSDIFFILRDRYLTEDIIHEAFLKASSKGPLLRSDANIPGWLKQIARRTVLDKLKKMKNERYVTDNFDIILNNGLDSVNDGTSVAIEVETKIRNEILHESIRELKSEYRVVLIMHYLESKPYKEICQQLGITEPVLTQRLVRARKKLLKHFLVRWTE